MFTATLVAAAVVSPLRAALTTGTVIPCAGTSLSVTVFPTGTPVVANSTVTGFGASAGRATSTSLVGTSGTAVPATFVIRSVGKPATKTGPGTDEKTNAGFVPALRPKISDSRRMRP